MTERFLTGAVYVNLKTRRLYEDVFEIRDQEHFASWTEDDIRREIDELVSRQRREPGIIFEELRAGVFKSLDELNNWFSRLEFDDKWTIYGLSMRTLSKFYSGRNGGCNNPSENVLSSPEYKEIDPSSTNLS